jgi:hypothetical protein
MPSQKKKPNWTAIEALATIGLVLIALLALVFGEGIYHMIFPKGTSTPFTQSPTAIMSIGSPATSGGTDSSTSSTAITDTTPILITINVSVQFPYARATYSLNHVQLTYNRLLLDVTVVNNSPYNISTCGLPRLVKTDYGEISPIIEKGGVYAEIKDTKHFCLFPSFLVPLDTSLNGWFVYIIESQRFSLHGMYTLYNLGSDFPPLDFQINS